MGRIRSIKPDFYTSEDIVSLSPLARLLYIATWCEADRDGRLAWKPRTLKMRYLPADACDIDALCTELTDAGLVILYGDGLAYIPSFTKHQHINPRETASQLPDPHACATRGARDSDARPRDSDVQGGREGKGRRETRDASRDDASGFAEFWTAYPNRKARQDALKAWSKIKPDGTLQASILKAVAEQCQGEDWRKEGGRFVPHAATWLNGRRWLDEAPAGRNGSLYDDAL
jgi:hypothetical protein